MFNRFLKHEEEEKPKPVKKPASSASTRNKVGRPSKFTDDRINKLVGYLEAGMTRSAASALSGISQSTFYQWMAENQQFGRPDGSLMQFSDAVEEAEASAQDVLLKEIRKDKGGAKWIMARRFRNDWGDRVDINTSGEQKVRIVVEYADIEGDTSEAAPAAASGYQRGEEVQRPELRAQVGQDGVAEDADNAPGA